jgi:hypothetical protein
VDQLEPGNDESLGIDLQRVHREAAGVLAPGVTLVGLEGLDDQQLAGVVEDGCVDAVVGQVAATVGRIVAHEDVACRPCVGLRVLESVAHGERRDEQQLGDPHREARQAPVGVHDAAVALVGLVDDRRRRGAAEVGRHLVADGLEGPAHDAGGDGVDLRTAAKGRARRHEAPVHLE